MVWDLTLFRLCFLPCFACFSKIRPRNGHGARVDTMLIESFIFLCSMISHFTRWYPSILSVVFFFTYLHYCAFIVLRCMELLIAYSQSALNSSDRLTTSVNVKHLHEPLPLPGMSAIPVGGVQNLSSTRRLLHVYRFGINSGLSLGTKRSFESQCCL